MDGDRTPRNEANRVTIRPAGCSGIGREAGNEGAGCRAFCRFGDPRGAAGPALQALMIRSTCLTDHQQGECEGDPGADGIYHANPCVKPHAPKTAPPWSRGWQGHAFVTS